MTKQMNKVKLVLEIYIVYRFKLIFFRVELKLFCTTVLICKGFGGTKFNKEQKRSEK